MTKDGARPDLIALSGAHRRAPIDRAIVAAWTIPLVLGWLIIAGIGLRVAVFVLDLSWKAH